MNVNISTEVTETTLIESDNAKVVVTNGKITLLKAYRTSVIGALEFEHLALLNFLYNEDRSIASLGCLWRKARCLNVTEAGMVRPA